jgi:hypothetical protein
MTKQRAPLSIDAALAKIAGQVEGAWKTMAREAGYEERTVRKWGDEAQEGEINIKAMLRLDKLYQEHGGEGFPLYETYGLLLGAPAAASYADQFEILRRVIKVAKETGEAEAALVRLSLPDASEADRRDAQREVLEALDELKNILPLLDRAERAPATPTVTGHASRVGPPLGRLERQPEAFAAGPSLQEHVRGPP